MSDTTNKIEIPQNQKLVSRQQVIIARSSSPIPSPEELEKYKKVDPTIVKVIMNSYKKQGNHRRKMEYAGLKEQIAKNRRPFTQALIGQICAFLIVMTTIACGAYTINQGHKITGGLLSGAGLFSIVYMFLKNKKAQNKKSNLETEHS